MPTMLVDGERVEITQAEYDALFPVQPEPEPSPQDVNVERDRRLIAGTSISIEGYGAIPLSGTDRDMIIITALLTKASGYKAAGIAAPVLTIRDTANINHSLTPDQMIELTSKGMLWVEDVMRVSWAMKDGDAPFLDGIPADFADDSYWP